MIVISAKQIKKSFGIDNIIKDATFSIKEKDKIGIIGVNGAGKSTLFKIITKEIERDSGDLYIDKRLSIGYMSQFLSFESKSSLWQEVSSVYADIIAMEKQLKLQESKMASEKNSMKLESLMKEYAELQHKFEASDGFSYESRIKGILKGLGFLESEYDKKISRFSGGQKTRIALAKILLGKNDILLLDEPTNYLDIESLEWLEAFLKDYKGIIMLISHDRYLLDSLCNGIFEIENGLLSSYTGNYTSYVKEKQRRRMEQEKKYDNQQKEIERQKAIIARYRQYNREKSIKQAESRERMLMKFDLIDKPDALPSKTHFRFDLSRRSGNDVIKIENLSKSYKHLLFKNFSMEIKRGERIALLGPNGIGKTTLLKIIKGDIIPDTGEIKLGVSVYPAYFDQEQEDLDERKMLIDEIWDEYPKLNQTSIRNALASFLFQGEDVFKEVSVLSGGEKSRLALLKLMLSKANFLLLDEPTNHLDMQSREVLENALEEYPGTVLFVSHDRYFLNKIATKVIELQKNGSKVYHGGYSSYSIKKTSSHTELNGKEKESKGRSEWLKQKEEEADERRKSKRLDEIENEIEYTENKIKEINTLLKNPDIFSDHEKCHSLYLEKEAFDSKLHELYEEWNSLMD